MMDRERQEKDLQEVFESTQASYRAAIENTFALQEQTLEFAQSLLEAPSETLQEQTENKPCNARGPGRTVQEAARSHGEPHWGGCQGLRELASHPLLSPPALPRVRGG
jgi:hypothetical protein